MSKQPPPATPLRRWLLLVQQLPTKPSSARIKAWRRLQQIGSVVLKNSVYVLPDTAQAREDFEWLAAEIRAAKGQASILAAEALTSAQDTEICDAFRQARATDYEALRRSAHTLQRTLPASVTSAARQQLERSHRALRDELARIQAIDFCGAPERVAAVAALDALAARLTRGTARTVRSVVAAPALSRQPYQRRVWVTRPRPGVDRMASAWLIQRFVDTAARFHFTSGDAVTLPKRAVRFDMFDAEFGHEADRCTFETLCDRFAIDDPGVLRIGTIVHDLDLKDRRYGAAEGPVVGSVIDGLQATYQDDHVLLQHGMALFAGLYESFDHSPAVTTPVRRRPVSGASKTRRRR